MKKLVSHKIQIAPLLSMIILLIASCSPQIKLTTSWANKQAKVKSAPAIMVMVLGKANSTMRQDIENNIVGRLKKEGFKAVPATGIFEPGIKHDSAELVSTLRKNNIDMLLTSAVVSRTENERFIPGAVQGQDIAVPSGGTATPYYSYNNMSLGYNSYYNYYNANNSYKIIEAQKVPGETIIDVYIVIESNLYQVETPELIWHGQSTSYTKEPTTGEVNTFSREVIGDIMKHNLLVK